MAAPHRPLRPLRLLLLSVALAACTSDVEPTDEQAITVGVARPALGVAGKPLAEIATGTVIGDELLVRFADDVTDSEARDLVAQARGAIVYQAQATGYYVIRFAGIPDAEAAAQTLRADARVVEAAWNHVGVGAGVGTSGTGIGTSPTVDLAYLQWNLYAMNMDPLKPRKDALGIIVAVLDTGAAYEDFTDTSGTYLRGPDLSEVDFAPGYDFINDDAHPNDDQRHGTHVTGIIAASSGIASVAPGATILPVKVLDGSNAGTELALAEGLMFAADNGAQVINMSLSFPPTYFPSRLLQNAIDYASRRGCVMIAASGNHGEDIVAYPAAFRDVIAVGASDLHPWFFTWGPMKHQWAVALDFLVRAPYSNHNYKLDVMAPAGTIPGDANFDGKPEAVLAQTFATGDPSDFDYYFYAGTSQAAAQVSALAAVMLKENPELTPFQVRAVLAENAKKMGFSLLSSETGRGAVRVKETLKATKKPHVTDYRQRYVADVVVTLHDVPGGTQARARVEILTEQGAPASNMKVYGLFTGGAFQSVQGTTDAAGQVSFVSPFLAGNMVVAFQVDAVTQGTGPDAIFDRPRGFVRIDSQSLELLALFGSGIGTSPTGIGTSPTDEPSGGEGDTGAGIGTSPTVILPTDPAQTPLTIAYDPALFEADYRPTLLLPNFSWGLATAPMAVAVDEAWFLATFPGAAERRVLSTGRGYGDSPFYFDAVTSFPTPITLAPTDGAPIRVSLVVLTFTSGIGTSPTGIGTSPTGIGTSPTSLMVDREYSGLDSALAASYQAVLDGWYANAAGIGTSPTFTGGFPQSTFDHLSAVANTYIPFADLELSAPASSYGTTLGAAAMPMAPVAPDTDGVGMGIAVLTP